MLKKSQMLMQLHHFAFLNDAIQISLFLTGRWIHPFKMIVFSPSKELLIITFWNSSVLTHKKNYIESDTAGFLHLNMGTADYNGMFYYLE